VDNECFLMAVSRVLQLDAQTLDWSLAPHITDSGLVRWLCDQHLGRVIHDEEIQSVVDLFVRLLEAEFESRPDRFRAIPGASAAVDTLMAVGWHVALATGGWEPSARLKLKAIGLDHGHIPLASASDASTRVEIVQEAIRRAAAEIGDTPRRVVCIGDAVWDVRTAAALELPFLGIGTGPRAGLLRAAGAGVVIPDLMDSSALRYALEVAPVPSGHRFSVSQAVEPAVER
jgi:phosphoglycolate phosphatase-like HAD superfamily hydrolase